MSQGESSAGRSLRTSERIVATGASPFLCPGSSQSVSRAVHLARLNAAWPICDQCDWRLDTEGLAGKTVESAERIRDHRANGICRTEFGVRGPYLNELDRRTAADLARVFSLCVNEHFHVITRAPDEMIAVRSLQTLSRTMADKSMPEIQPTRVELSPVVVGYDGRNSSPDIFVGVTAAVREFGLTVFDIGRCTAASIQEATRSLPECAGAVFVTGSGMPVSWTGLDVSDSNGDPVPVVWKDFGVRLQHVSVFSASETQSCDRTFQEDDGLRELLQRARSQSKSCEDQNTASTPLADSHLRLLLPAMEERNLWRTRLSRHSGEHHVVDFEPRYRQWLSRWYGRSSAMRVQVRSDDIVIRQRVEWLAEQSQLEFIARPRLEQGLVRSCHLTMTIEEDDRKFQVQNQSGDAIPPDRLAALINLAIPSQASHVTAHADSASGRFWLTDSARSAAAGLTEHVRDGLASLGLLIRLIESGKIELQP